MEPSFLTRQPGPWERALGLVFQSFCLECGERVEGPALGGLCAGCWKSMKWTPRPSAGPYAAAPFQGAWRKAIHAYKFEGRTGFRRPFARVLESLAFGLPVDAVLGVPASRSGLKRRGFDHVAGLAEPLAGSLGLPYLDKVLAWTRETAKQAELGREARFENVRGAFRAEPARSIQGARLLLVDDVMTTGATLQACVAPLLAAGAASVDCLVLAVRDLEGPWQIA